MKFRKLPVGLRYYPMFELALRLLVLYRWGDLRPIALVCPPILMGVSLCLRFFAGYVVRRALGPFPNLRVGYPGISLMLQYKESLSLRIGQHPL